ncbi:MAG: hypothetical protein LBK13_03425 [Spirochaetales bacterium]|nr:hypothetical protein [Spirochaetales bacterium]
MHARGSAAVCARSCGDHIFSGFEDLSLEKRPAFFCAGVFSHDFFSSEKGVKPC